MPTQLKSTGRLSSMLRMTTCRMLLQILPFAGRTRDLMEQIQPPNCAWTFCSACRRTMISEFQRLVGRVKLHRPVKDTLLQSLIQLREFFLGPESARAYPAQPSASMTPANQIAADTDQVRLHPGMSCGTRE